MTGKTQRMIWAGMAGLLALGACVPAAPIAVAPLPAGLQGQVEQSNLAMAIVDECPGGFAANEGAYNLLTAALLEEAVTQGLPGNMASVDALVMGAMNETVLQKLLFSYLERRNITLSDPASWCAAGQAEMADRSGIAQYLVAK